MNLFLLNATHDMKPNVMGLLTSYFSQKIELTNFVHLSNPCIMEVVTALVTNGKVLCIVKLGPATVFLNSMNKLNYYKLSNHETFSII